MVQRFTFWVTLFACVAMGYVHTFEYLQHEDQPVPVDTVVLFLGPVTQDRIWKARQLLMDGYAKRLIIPSQNFVFPASHDVFSLKDGKLKENKYFHRVQNGHSYPYYYENTHIEALETKRMMDMAGYSSAIIIGGPFQMRRIRIICKNVFHPGDYRLKFVGSRFVCQGNSRFRFYLTNMEKFISEYTKILGFCVYQNLGPSE
ncbi:MAG: hypothetical protein MI747_16325 [Desulfobacterales bacterium]|nr:hypothetical protein [Desulfobacterales bacterium]